MLTGAPRSIPTDRTKTRRIPTTGRNTASRKSLNQSLALNQLHWAERYLHSALFI
jgi:hypothetical protein